MIHTLSLASTATPMVAPITQWFGSGLGHMGSTSNRGAITPAALTLDMRSSRAELIPSATTTAARAMPMRRSRLIFYLQVSDTRSVQAIIHHVYCLSSAIQWSTTVRSEPASLAGRSISRNRWHSTTQQIGEDRL